MKKSQLLTRTLPLVVQGYDCIGGPLAGSTIYLSEYSTTSAYIRWNGYVGRYIPHKSKGRVRWEAMGFKELSKLDE